LTQLGKKGCQALLLFSERADHCSQSWFFQGNSGHYLFDKSENNPLELFPSELAKQFPSKASD